MHRPNKETAARWWNAPANREGGGWRKNEDDEFLVIEHHLRREELERDDFEQEL